MNINCSDASVKSVIVSLRIAEIGPGVGGTRSHQEQRAGPGCTSQAGERPQSSVASFLSQEGSQTPRPRVILRSTAESAWS
jgi:hypothetical protein